MRLSDTPGIWKVTENYVFASRPSTHNSIKYKTGLSSLLRSLEYVSEVTHALAFLEGYEGKAHTQFPATGT